MLLFCTTPFTPMAKAIAEGKGMSGLRIIEMDHPLGGLTDPEITQRFQQVIDAVFAHIEGRSP